MRVTEEEYEKLLKNRPTRKAPPKSKHYPQHEQVEEAKAPEKNTSRPLVRITSFNCQLQDPDNTFCKYHVDALRYAGIIKDDRAADIDLFVYQVKVKTRKEQRVEIEVIKE
jgi:Holliday junction resolvase RusA-like endonuclease